MGKKSLRYSAKGNVMRSTLSFLALALVLGLLVRTGLAADDKKDAKKDDKKVEVKHDTPEKMVKKGQLSGKLLSVSESDKTLEIELTYSLPKLNMGEYNALLQSQRDYQVALAKRDFAGARNHLAAAAQHQAKLYTYEKKTKKLKLETIDPEKFIVRAANPPPQFDDKGQPKKYTRKELDELRGPNKSLPGFETDGFSALRSGQTILAYLVKRKEDPKDKERPMPKPKTKEELEEALLANLPQVSMVVILVEPKE
jgi:hypothetical protein